MADDALRGRDAFLEGAEAFLAAGDDDTALAAAEARLLRMPGDLDANSVMCRVRIRQGRLEEAAGILRGMDASLAGLAKAYASLGDAYLVKGMQEAAQSCYRRLSGLNPDAPSAGGTDDPLPVVAPAPETGRGGEAEDSAEVPSGFQTVTLAELYILQGHLRPAAEVLEAVIGRQPENERARAMLDEVREMILREEARQRYPIVIDELSRWLDNIGRLRGHAA